MLSRAAFGLGVLLACASALACGGVPGSPDETVEAVGAALAKNDLGFVWEALPETYQDDVHDIVHAFAEVSSMAKTLDLNGPVHC